MEFENVCMDEGNDISGKAAQKDDKIDTKSKKGLVYKQPRMGIDIGCKHSVPHGDNRYI